LESIKSTLLSIAMHASFLEPPRGEGLNDHHDHGRCDS
jgi:hypothetical protein